MARATTTADVFNALGEERRREIVDALAGGEMTVTELVERLGLPQPQVSKHLKVLREVDIVRVRLDGRHHRYRVNGAALRPLHDWVAGFAALWNDRYDRLDDLLHETPPQPHEKADL